MTNISVPKDMTAEHILISLVEANALNCVGYCNFNAYGAKDSLGLESCTEIFVDNFVLQVLVPDYLSESENKNKKYAEAGALTKSIWNLLKRSEMRKSSVTTCCFSKMSKPPSDTMMLHMPFSNPNHKVNDYYLQDFKITCCNETFEKVINFLSTADFLSRGLFLKDIDVTQDFMGCISKNEVIEQLLTNQLFRLQGCSDSQSDAEKNEKSTQFTILDNDVTVGNNCLTFLGTFRCLKIRCKLYNKMVQMLESKAVRERIGNHWMDWVNQTGTRLAIARDRSKDRGLTRIEVSVTAFNNEKPSSDYLRNVMYMVINLVEKDMVYSTPHSSTWKSYCNMFIHSLVVSHQDTDQALIVYSYNELNGKLCGHLFKDWSSNKDWVFSNILLSGNLPIDWIEVTQGTSQHDDNVILTVDSHRLFKYRKNFGTSFSTRLVNTNAYFTHAPGITEVEASKRLINAGFLPHDNCLPILSLTAANKNSKTDIQYESLGNSDIVIKSIACRRVYSSQIQKVNLQKRLNELINQKRIVKNRLKEQQVRMEHMKMLQDACARSNTISLLDYIGQSLNIIAIKELEYFSGKKYMIILKNSDNRYVNCISSSGIALQIMNSLDEEKVLVRPFHYMTLFGAPLGKIHVTGYEWTAKRNKIAVCKLDFFVETTTEKYEGCTEDNDKHLAESVSNRTNLKFASKTNDSDFPFDKSNITIRTSENGDNEQSWSKLNYEHATETTCDDEDTMQSCGRYLGEHNCNNKNFKSISKTDLKAHEPSIIPQKSKNEENFCTQPYKHLPGLISLKRGTRTTIVSKMWIKHYTKQKLAVKMIDGIWYQAGNYLESQDMSISLPQNIWIKQSRLNISTRRREAVCELM